MSSLTAPGDEATADDSVDIDPTEQTDDSTARADDTEYTFDDVSVVMGTYNEEEAIGTVLSDIDEVTGGRAASSSASTAPRTGRRRSPASTARASSNRSRRGTVSPSARRF